MHYELILGNVPRVAAKMSRKFYSNEIIEKNGIFENNTVHHSHHMRVENLEVTRGWMHVILSYDIQV